MIRVSASTLPIEELGDRYLRIDVSLKKHMDRLADALREIDSGKSSAGKR